MQKEEEVKVLVINCGSSSVKFQLIERATQAVLAKGQVERIGSGQAAFEYTPGGGEKSKETATAADHRVAIRIILDHLTDPDRGVISGLDEIAARKIFQRSNRA